VEPTKGKISEGDEEEQGLVRWEILVGERDAKWGGEASLFPASRSIQEKDSARPEKRGTGRPSGKTD